MKRATSQIILISGYRLSSQTVCAAVESALSASTYSYRIPAGSWICWITYRIKRFGLVTLLGHIQLSLYLRLRGYFSRFIDKRTWDETTAYPTPSFTNRIQTQRSLMAGLKDAGLVIMIEPFRLPRAAYNSNIPFLEITWGSIPAFRGDSSGWWEKVMTRQQFTEVGIIRRSADASEITVLATWKVPLQANDTIGRVRLRQATILRAHLPAFLESYIRADVHKKSKTPKESIQGFSYISPTLQEYLRYNNGTPVPQNVVDRRRTALRYKIMR